MQKDCSHKDEVRDVSASAAGCEECLKTGGKWVALRICLTCGHVGCCDSTAGAHATQHFHSTHHNVMQSFEPGEIWGWCYVDETMLKLDRKYHKPHKEADGRKENHDHNR